MSRRWGTVRRLHPARSRDSFAHAVTGVPRAKAEWVESESGDILEPSIPLLAVTATVTMNKVKTPPAPRASARRSA